MKRLFFFGALNVIALMVVLPSWAATNLNSSKSNIYRLVYDANLVTRAQGDALAKALDARGPLTEADAKKWLAANFKTFGIDGKRIKLIEVMLQRQIGCSDSCNGKSSRAITKGREAESKGKAVASALRSVEDDCFCYESITTLDRARQARQTTPILVLLLSNPADEAQAIAVSDPGPDGKKGSKK